MTQLPTPFRLLLAIFVLMGVGGCEKKPTKLRIGHLAPLSGPDRERGLAAVRGVQLAVETINANKDQFVGGNQLEVIHADTRGEAVTAESQAVRLALVNRVVTIIGGDTREQMARLIPVAKDYNLTIIGSAGGAGISSNVFGLGVSLDQRVDAIVSLLEKQERSGSVLLLVDRRDAGFTAASERTAELLRPKGKKVTALPFKDRNEIWPQLRRDKIDAVVLFTTGADAAAIVKAMTKTSITIYSGDESEAHHLLDEPAASECFAFSSLPAKPASESDKDFAELYQNKFHEAPTLESRTCWDAIQVLCASIRDAKSLIADKLVPKVRGIKAGTRLSGNFTMPPDQVARGEVYVLQIKDGKLVDHSIAAAVEKKSP